MSYIQTRQVLDTVLKLIGNEGLSGIQTAATTPSDAVRELLRHAHINTELLASRIVNEFRRQELVTFESENHGIRLVLSVKGIHRLQRAQLQSITVPTPEQWDGKWRMVLFDIPARHAESRYILTSQIKRLGFVMVQRSMWVHPYPCFDQTIALLQYANLQPFVTLAEISRIDTASEQRLRKQYPDLHVTARQA